MEELALKSHIEMLRKKYRISMFPNDIPLVCNECDLENMKFADLNDFGYVQVRLDCFGISNPYHKATLVGYNSQNGAKWFLVDPTYGQFFKNKKFNNYMYSNYHDFTDKLLKDGYIEYTLDNMFFYVDGFANSKAFVRSMNNDIVYANVYNFLIENNIIYNKNKKR